MKFVVMVVGAALAGLTAAQSGLSGLPSCAQKCATNSIPSSCGVDVKCICSSSSFITGVTCCVATACDTADQEKTIQYADSLCGGAGVTNLPTAASCASSTASAASSGSSSVSSSASAVASSVTSAASSVASSQSAAASSVASSASSEASSASSAVASLTASSTSSSATAASSGSAGNRLVVQGLGVAGLVAGAVAFI